MKKVKTLLVLIVLSSVMFAGSLQTASAQCFSDGMGGWICPNPPPPPPPGDTTAPSVSISNPSNGETVENLLEITASASDSGSGVNYVSFYIDGNRIKKDTSSPYSVLWNTYEESNADHTIRAYAVDNEGNSKSHTITVTVRNYDFGYDYAIYVHGFTGDANSLSSVRNEIGVYYTDQTSLSYYSNDMYFGERSINDPIGPYKDTGGAWVVTTSQQSAAKFLKDDLTNWLEDKHPGSIDIYAHSMGGLVVRNMIQHWFSDGEITSNMKIFDIRSVTTIGTPHEGTTIAKIATTGMELFGLGFLDMTVKDFLTGNMMDLLDWSADRTWFIRDLVDYLWMATGMNTNPVITDVFDEFLGENFDLSFLDVSQVWNLDPDHRFIDYMNSYKTPGSGIEYFTIAGDKNYGNVLDLMFEAIPFWGWGSYSYDFVDDFWDLKPTVVFSYVETYNPINDQLIDVDISLDIAGNSFIYEYTVAPKNDKVVNFYSALASGAPADNIYSFYSDHSGVKSDNNPLYWLEQIAYDLISSS